MMWNLVYLTLLLLPLSTALSGKALVDYINKQGLFKAVYNPSPSFDELGLLPEDPEMAKLKMHTKDNYDMNVAIPEHFDAAEHWPHCAEVINIIRDQSRCGSCWAVSAASVFSDRICIATNGSRKVSISGYAIAACNFKAGYHFILDGCESHGFSFAVRKFVQHGAPTGSEEDVRQGCVPYFLPHCSHNGDNTTKYPLCEEVEQVEVSGCFSQCMEGYPIRKVEDDLYFGREGYGLMGEELIQREIMESGPVIAQFKKYESFKHYDSGIYRRVKDDKYLITKSVRIVGWGVENGTKYWRIANSYNWEWGENGFFRLIRGTPEAEPFEVMAVYIDLTRLPTPRNIISK